MTLVLGCRSTYDLHQMCERTCEHTKGYRTPTAICGPAVTVDLFHSRTSHLFTITRLDTTLDYRLYLTPYYHFIVLLLRFTLYLTPFYT